MQNKLLIKVEVVFATSAQYRLITCEIPFQSTILEAINSSGIIEYFPEISLQDTLTHKAHKVGIFGKIKDLSTQLQNGDRVEIYRPLPKSAMILRKARAKLTRRFPQVLKVRE